MIKLLRCQSAPWRHCCGIIEAGGAASECCTVVEVAIGGLSPAQLWPWCQLLDCYRGGRVLAGEKRGPVVRGHVANLQRVQQRRLDASPGRLQGHSDRGRWNKRDGLEEKGWVEERGWVGRKGMGKKRDGASCFIAYPTSPDPIQPPAAVCLVRPDQPSAPAGASTHPFSSNACWCRRLVRADVAYSCRRLDWIRGSGIYSEARGKGSDMVGC